MSKPRKRKTHCKYGHEFTPENTYFFGGEKRYKQCIACGKAYRRNWVSKRDFGGNKEAVLKRDGYRCVQCGMTSQQHNELYGVELTVDHKDKRGRHSPQSLKNNAMDNLQTLCIRCHSVKDSVLIKLSAVQAKEIKQLKGRRRVVDLAEQYGVSQQTIHDIWIGRTWKYI